MNLLASALLAGIAAAHYEAPAERYGHFALGRPHEYTRLVATTSEGRRVALELPQNEVFEDREPRLVKLAAGAPTELLAIVSSREAGARLALFGLREGKLARTAQGPSIGTPMRWLNPVGVADLDDDGRAEIAAVTTPHIGGTLRVYRREGSALAEIAALEGFSNHVYRSPELGLSTPATVGGQPRLVVPDVSRRVLRVLALEGGRLVETRRCALPAPVTGAILPSGEGRVAVGLVTGQRELSLESC